MNLEVIILMGLQGAGKSTFYYQNFSSSHGYVSKDTMGNRRNKSLIQENQIRSLLSAGLPLVVDNTNVSKTDREEIIKIAKEYEAKVILYYFPLKVEESIARNEGPERKVVPIAGIYSMAKKLAPPDRSEGYDEMYEVRMHRHGFFEITHPGNLSPSFAPLL